MKVYTFGVKDYKINIFKDLLFGIIHDDANIVFYPIFPLFMKMYIPVVRKMAQ